MYRINKFFTHILVFIVTFGCSANLYSQSKEESASNSLPFPEVLFAKHIEAIGGEQSILAHSTKIIDGKLNIQAMGIEGTIHIVAAAPNKLQTTVGLGQFGESNSGYNGTVGWTMDPMSGSKILEGEALIQMIAQSDFYGSSLHLGKNAVEKKTVETVTFNEGEQYKVLLADENGEESYLYFSKATGLLSGIDKMEIGAMGKVPTQIRMSNYVEFGGVKTARRISSSQNGVETIIEIDTVSYDPLAENAFDLPEELQRKEKQ